jgi:attractin
VDGVCTCDAEYMGAACNIAVCPNNCNNELRQGHCDREAHRCICSPAYGGSDCSQMTALGYWTTIAPPDFSPPGSASHGAAVWRDTLHILSGENYERGGDLLYFTYDFNGNIWETVHIDGSAPDARYGASTVIYGDKIFMYGGVVASQNGPCDELWAYDVSAKNWENITVKTEACNASHAMCGPLKSVGHSATIVSGAWYTELFSAPGATAVKKKGNSQYMIVIFGHSPQFGYLNTVQEYNFGTREWNIVQTRGYPVKGGYGHSATYDPMTEKIYVYGGIVSESDSTQMLSNKLYSYEPATRTWILLTSAPTARFLHTANFISSGLMMVFGGNTHNDTSHSFGAKCYSQDLIYYDVLCDTWHVEKMPKDLEADLSRFGHTAVVFEKSLYIYGGFDGQMLSDMLKFTPGDCSSLQKPETCLTTFPGHKCLWDIQRSMCVSAGETPRFQIFARDQDQFMMCRKESRIVMTQQHLHDYERCSELLSCQSCVSTSFDCSFCGVATSRGVCTKDKCPDMSYKFRAQPTPFKRLENCSGAAEPVCNQLHGN